MVMMKITMVMIVMMVVGAMMIRGDEVRFRVRLRITMHVAVATNCSEMHMRICTCRPALCKPAP